jgi:acetolactate synthase small subunit
MTAKLKISADDQDGVLQRIIFEFSRRNISIDRLTFVRHSEISTIEVHTGKATDAAKIAKSVGRIDGIRDIRLTADGSGRQDEYADGRERKMNPQEMLG